MNNSMKIEIFEYEEGYTIEVNGEVILECLGDEEIQDITLGELSELQLKVEAGLI